MDVISLQVGQRRPAGVHTWLVEKGNDINTQRQQKQPALDSVERIDTRQRVGVEWFLVVFKDGHLCFRLCLQAVLTLAAGYTQWM